MSAATSGAQLWEAFVVDAGINADTPYDAALLDGVASRLRLSLGKDMSSRIAAANPSTIDVLVAVLSAMQPWALMMRDLLSMMIAAGASKTQTQLRAHVDIAAASGRLDLDLHHFSEAIDSYESVQRLVLRHLWSPTDLAELWQLLPLYQDGRLLPWDQEGKLPPDVRSWLEAYEPPGGHDTPVPDVRWPSPPASPPQSGHEELDRALMSAFRGWSAALARMSAAAPTRLELYNLDQESVRGDGDPDRQLAGLDHDRMAGFFLRGLYTLAAHVAGGEWEWSDGRGDSHSPQQVIDFVGGLDVAQVLEDELESVRRLLSLPVWRNRYDVYSNWVFTQILGALEGTGLAVDALGGRIDFAFAATRMAVSQREDVTLSVFSELRSRLRGPSKKRASDVQPDYSVLVGDPADPALSSVVEVECKQYKRASPSNFGSALHDYALARPHARVLLTTYGPISERSRVRTFARIAPEMHPRCHLLADVRPLQESSVQAFRDTLREAVRAQAPSLFGARIDVSGAASIELRWAESSSADLDLHLAIDRPQATAISYTHRNEERGEPFAWLLDDVRSGPGPEVIEIGSWLTASYRLSVNDYSGGELADAAPEVTISWSSGSIVYSCPAGTGTWWDVALIDGGTGEVTELGQRRS